MAIAVAAVALLAPDARAQVPGLPALPILTDPGNGGIVPFEGATALALIPPTAGARLRIAVVEPSGR